MALSNQARTYLDAAITDPSVSKEIADAIDVSAHTQQAAITMNTVTASSGSLPTTDGATTIANTATPTVVELLELCMEIRAKVIAINTALHNFGVTL